MIKKSKNEGKGIKDKLVNGINLCNDSVIYALDDYLKAEAIPYACHENNGCYIKKNELIDIFNYSSDLIIIKDFNCQKTDISEIAELMLECTKTIILSTDNYSLIDELIKIAKRKEVTSLIGIIDIKGIKYCTSELLYRLRFVRGLDIF